MAGLMFSTRMKHRGRKKVSRDIAAPERATLADLAHAVVRAYGFDMDHCYGFFDADYEGFGTSAVRYELFDDLEPGSHGTPGCERIMVSEAFVAAGSRLTFLFDYGDGWLFDVRLIGQDSEGGALPRVTSSNGEAPEQYG